MLAPHAGACHKCHGAIPTGDPVRSFNRPALGTWYHPACVGSKATPSAPVALTASVTPATVSSNGHEPSAASTLAPSAALSLDVLATALAAPDAPCPCDWLGVSYDKRCAWLLAATRAAQRSTDGSWKRAELDALASACATGATPDVARDMECYAEGLRHGMRLLGASIAEPSHASPPPHGIPTAWGSYEAPGSFDWGGHVGYGTLWDVANEDTDAPVLPTEPTDVLACTCLLMEAPDGQSEVLLTCVVCTSKLTGSAP